MIGTIDQFHIYGDEDGFHLLIYTDDEREPHHYRIGLPDQIKAEVDRTIGAWLAEGDRAKVWAGAFPDPEMDAYAADDPKHPDYHDTMSGLYDSREGK